LSRHLLDSSGGGSAAPLRRTPADQEALAKRWAPTVIVDRQDRWRPSDPRHFVQASALVYDDPKGQTQVARAGSIDPAKLGVKAATASYAALSSELGRDVSAWEFTRPYSKPNDRVHGLHEASGFSLVRTSTVEAVTLDEAPMFYEWRNDSTLIYWFFSDGSALPQNVLDILKAALQLAHLDAGSEGATLGAVSTPGTPDVGALLLTRAQEAEPAALADAQGMFADLSLQAEIHQGDWEGLTYIFRGDEPASVQLHQHGDPVHVPLSSLHQKNGHYVVYSGRGSHSTVADPNKADPEVVDVGGDAWVPTDDHILDVRLQPWYSFGGAWGRVRLPVVGDIPGAIRTLIMRRTESPTSHPLDVWEEATGPLGPSSWKTA
jgi:hypothetical protein